MIISFQFMFILIISQVETSGDHKIVLISF